MADFTEKDIQELLSNRDNALASAIAAYAMRPQKTSTITNSSSTTTPYAISDLLRARDTIGRSTAKLNEALKPRETYLYSLSNALSAMPQQQGPGSWLSALGRGFGLGAAARTNAAVDRAQKVYEAEMQDLANRLAYDKAMGDTTTQYQRQDMGYTEMPYGGGKGGGQEGTDKKIASIESSASNLADIYKTIEDNPTAFSTVGGIKQDEATRALREGIETAGITELQHREFEYLRNMMPNGFATTINAAAEQKFMAPYTASYKTGTGSQKKAQIKNMLGGIYDAYKADAAAQGFRMPITREQYIKSRLESGRPYNKNFYIKSDAPMYKDQKENIIQPKTNQDYMKQFMEGTL